MAESTRSAAQERRAEGRDRRRSMLTEPFERLSEATGSGESSGSVDVRETLKRAAVTAAAAAAVGAAAGAAKALLDRREAGGDNDQPKGRADVTDQEDDAPEGRVEVTDQQDDDAPHGRAEPEEQEEDRDPEGRAEETDEDERDEQSQGRAEPADEEEDEAQQARAEEPDADDEQQQQGRAETQEDEDADDATEQQGRAEPDESRKERDGADLEDAANADGDPHEIIPKAREELERMLGREAESVSGFERRDGHWSVTLEVVEVRRVPDSTDVLASYELVLDDDGHVARMTRKGRYRRSQLEGRG
jgi:hypothetical protein